MGDRADPNEFEGPQNCESYNRIGIGNESGLSQACGNSHHVLFSDSNVKKMIRESIDEWLRRPESKMRREEDNPGILVSQIGEGFGKCAPHLSNLLQGLLRLVVGHGQAMPRQ